MTHTAKPRIKCVPMAHCSWKPFHSHPTRNAARLLLFSAEDVWWRRHRRPPTRIYGISMCEYRTKMLMEKSMGSRLAWHTTYCSRRDKRESTENRNLNSSKCLLLFSLLGIYGSARIFTRKIDFFRSQNIVLLLHFQHAHGDTRHNRPRSRTRTLAHTCVYDDERASHWIMFVFVSCAWGLRERRIKWIDWSCVCGEDNIGDTDTKSNPDIRESHANRVYSTLDGAVQWRI